MAGITASYVHLLKGTGQGLELGGFSIIKLTKKNGKQQEPGIPDCLEPGIISLDKGVLVLVTLKCRRPLGPAHILSVTQSMAEGGPYLSVAGYRSKMLGRGGGELVTTPLILL